MSSARCTLALAVMLAMLPKVASADPKAEAKPHIEQAMRLHAIGKYTDALRELTLAYALDPQPELLYAIGQVYVKLGDCDGATAFYQRFLTTNPDARDASVARQAIASCASPPRSPPAKIVDEPTSAPPGSADRVDPVPSQPATSQPAPPLRRPRHDWLGWTLVAGGAATGIVGAVYYGTALATRTDASDASSYEQFVDRLHGARRERTISYALFGGAALLAGAGLVHVFLHDDGSEIGVAVIPERGGARATWTARF